MMQASLDNRAVRITASNTLIITQPIQVFSSPKMLFPPQSGSHSDCLLRSQNSKPEYLLELLEQLLESVGRPLVKLEDHALGKSLRFFDPENPIGRHFWIFNSLPKSYHVVIIILCSHHHGLMALTCTSISVVVEWCRGVASSISSDIPKTQRVLPGTWIHRVYVSQRRRHSCKWQSSDMIQKC